MKIIKQIPFDLVVQSWLQSEWYLPNFDPIRDQVPQSIINSNNLHNLQENQVRLNTLRALREPMIDPLPQDIIWYTATFDKEDINRTFIVPSGDWGKVSNNTYHPLKIMENLSLEDVHTKKITGIKASLPKKLIDKRLILVASEINSVCTIIEGNHRAVAIFMDALERNLPNPIIDEVFVGISPNLLDYTWHIEKYLKPSSSV